MYSMLENTITYTQGIITNYGGRIKSDCDFSAERNRKVIHQNGWWFSVVDVVQALTDQSDFQNARKYWNKLAESLKTEGSESVTNCHRLKLPAPDRKMREADCANTKATFRLIQSIS